MKKITFLMSLFLPLLGVNKVAAQLAPSDLTNGKRIAIRAVSNNLNHYFLTNGSCSRVYNPENCMFEVVETTYNDASETSDNQKYFRLKYLQDGKYLKSGSYGFTENESEAAVFYAQEITQNGVNSGTAPKNSIVQSDLQAGIEFSQLVRFVRADASGDHTFLNSGQTTPTYASGTGGYSAFCVYDAQADVDGIIKAHIYEDTQFRSGWTESNVAGTVPQTWDGTAATINEATKYGIRNKSLSQWLSGSASFTTDLASLGKYIFVSTGKSYVYKIYNVATQKYVKWTLGESGNTVSEAADSDTDNSLLWWVRRDDNNVNNQVDILPYGQFTQALSAADGALVLGGFADAAAKWEMKIPPLAVTMSTADNKVYYTIKGLRNNKYANYKGANGAHIMLDADLALGSYWYFVAASEVENVPEGLIACRIYNVAKELPLANPDSKEFADQVYYLREYMSANNWGYTLSRSTNNTEQVAWNDYGGNGEYIGNYSYGSSEEGSMWELTVADITEEQLRTDAQAVKTSALNFISSYEGADYFTYPQESVAEAKSVVEACDMDGALHEALENAFTITATKTALEAVEKRGAPEIGDYIQIKSTLAANSSQPYLVAVGNVVNKTADATLTTTVWKVESGAEDGQFVLKNIGAQKYMGAIPDNVAVAMVDAGEAGPMKWVVNAGCEVAFGNHSAESATSHDYGHLNGGNLIGWGSAAGASQWKVVEVKAESIQSDLENVMAFYGDKWGLYSGKTDEVNNVIAQGRALLSAAEPDTESLILTNESLHNYLSSEDNVSFNKPQPGAFMRIRTAPEWKADSPYLTAVNSTVSGKTDRAAFGNVEDETTIFYLDGDSLVAYANGYYLKSNSNHGGYATSAAGNTGALTVTFQAAVTNVPESFNLNISTGSSNRLLHTGISGNNCYMDAGSNVTGSSDNVNGYSFRLEEVTELPVKIVSQKGLATFWTPVALRVPETVDVYTLEVGENGDVVVLSPLEAGSVLPAQTGVLLAGNPGSYNFAIVKDNTDDSIGSLSGQVAYTTYTSDGMTYTLQNLASGKMGFKKYTGTTMGAFKSYLHTSEATVSALSMVFADGDATGVESVQAQTEKDVVIYDLNGRRVTSPRKGVYIVNGVKVIIK